MTTEVIALIIEGVVALTAVLGLVYTHYRELAQVRERLATLETKVEPFWAAIRENLPDFLKTLPAKGNPISKEQRDLYLDKLKNSTITRAEALELEQSLREGLREAQDSRDTAVVIAILLGIALVAVSSSIESAR